MTDAVPQPDSPTSRLPWTTWLIIIAAVAVLTHLITITNHYAYDGALIIDENPRVTGGDWLDLWTTDYWDRATGNAPRSQRDLLYRPLTMTTFRLLYQLRPWPPDVQHGLNLALHALICVLVAGFVRRESGRRQPALLAGLGFAVLPIHVDVVANLVGRADLLATAGILLTLMLQRRLANVRRSLPLIGWSILASVTAFGTLAAKESGVAILCVAPLYLLWREVRSPAPDKSPRGKRLTFLAVRLIYLVPAAVAYFVLRYHALGGQLTHTTDLTRSVNALADASLAGRCLGALQLWGMYWAKMFYPRVLCIEYSINSVRVAQSLTHPMVLLGIALLAAVLLFAVHAWRRGDRWPAFLTAGLLIAYLPTGNVFFLIRVFFAERLWYLPSVFAIALVAHALRPWLRYRVVMIVLCLVGLTFAARSLVRTAAWKGNGTLYKAAYRDHPDSTLANALLGYWYLDRGRPDDALPFLQRSVQIDPGHVDAYRGIGNAYLKLDQPAAALEALRTAVMLAPDDPRSHEALQQAKSLLAASAEPISLPAPTTVEHELETLDRLLSVARYSEAVGRCVEVEARFGGSPAWRRMYAHVLLYAGSRDLAIEQYKHAVALLSASLARSDDAPADGAPPPQLISLRNDTGVELAMLLLERRGQSDLEEVDEIVGRFMSTPPIDPRVYVCAAELAALRGDIDTAVAHYDRALEQVGPNSPYYALWLERKRSLGE
jgi:tetratricopeptide (TPR) repeat protein